MSRWLCALLWVCTGGVEVDVYSYGCALRVSRWFCAWMCAGGVKVVVCSLCAGCVEVVVCSLCVLAMGVSRWLCVVCVRWGCRGGCV